VVNDPVIATSVANISLHVMVTASTSHTPPTGIVDLTEIISLHIAVRARATVGLDQDVDSRDTDGINISPIRHIDRDDLTANTSRHRIVGKDHAVASSNHDTVLSDAGMINVLLIHHIGRCGRTAIMPTHDIMVKDRAIAGSHHGTISLHADVAPGSGVRRTDRDGRMEIGLHPCIAVKDRDRVDLATTSPTEGMIDD